MSLEDLDDYAGLFTAEDEAQLAEICANPEKLGEHLRRTAALMSESGGAFDARVLISAASWIEQTPLIEASDNRKIAALKAAIGGLLPILEGVRFTVGLGKTQLARIEDAKALVQP